MKKKCKNLRSYAFTDFFSSKYVAVDQPRTIFQKLFCPALTKTKMYLCDLCSMSNYDRKEGKKKKRLKSFPVNKAVQFWRLPDNCISIQNLHDLQDLQDLHDLHDLQDLRVLQVLQPWQNLDTIYKKPWQGRKIWLIYRTGQP